MICTCPACSTVQNRNECSIGNMGTLRWFRCRYCGMMWNKQRKPKSMLNFKRKTAKAH